MTRIVTDATNVRAGKQALEFQAKLRVSTAGFREKRSAMQWILLGGGFEQFPKFACVASCLI